METSENLSFITTLLPVVSVIFIIAVGVVLLTQQFRKNLYRQQLKQEELKNQYQTELLRSSIEVQEEERKRIARDMHDELGATLSIARMHLLQAERQNGVNGEKMQSDLENVRHLIETSINNIRRISHQLMPPQLETFGLVKTLEAVSEQLNKTCQVKLELKTPDFMPELSWSVKLTYYRIFMELINNTIKHSGASEITIELRCDAENSYGTYTDNGSGIAADAVFTGMGQKSIKGRVNSLGGTIESGNHPLGGFLATIIIPLGT